MLEYVYYPTGGYTHYEFEINNVEYAIKRIVNGFETMNVNNGNAGGVRIAQITDYDGTNSSSRTYSYSGGILYQYPLWGIRPDDNAFNQNTGFYQNMNNTTLNIEMWSSNSVFTLPEDYVGYSTVNIIYDNGSKETHQFTTWSDYPDEIAQIDNYPILSYYFPISSRSFCRGKTKSVLYIDSSNNPVKSIQYVYNLKLDPSENSNSRNYQILENSVFAVQNNYNIFMTSGIIHNFSTLYCLFYFPMYLDSQIVREYSVPYDGTFVTTRKGFDYNSYNQLVADTMINSSGGYEISLYKYPTSYEDCPPALLNDAYTAMLYEYNMLDKIVEKTHKENNNVVSSWYNQYSDYGTDDIPLISAQYELLTNIPLSSFIGLDSNGELASGTEYSLNHILGYDTDFNLSQAKR